MPDAFAKRLACQIAAQLPDSQQEALEVLGLVREVVMNLGGGWSRPVAVQPTQLFATDRKDQAELPAVATADLIGPRDKASQG